MSAITCDDRVSIVICLDFFFCSMGMAEQFAMSWISCASPKGLLIFSISCGTL